MPLESETLRFLAYRTNWRNLLVKALQGEIIQAQVQAAEAAAELENTAAAQADGTQTEQQLQAQVQTAAEAAELKNAAAGAAGDALDSNVLQTGSNTGNDEDECEIPARVEDTTNEDNPDPCANVINRLSQLVPITCFRQEDGWPSSEQLYKLLQDILKRAKTGPEPTDSQSRLISLQRQINVLESYRKMLLHKKQGVCQFYRAWCQIMSDEERSQQELQAHLNWAPVGLTVAPAEEST